MNNPILAQITPENIIECGHHEIYKLANLLKFSEQEIIPVLERYEKGIDLKFNIAHYLQNKIYIRDVYFKKDRKVISRKKMTLLDGIDYDFFDVNEEIDKRELELKYNIIKLLNKEEKIGRDDNSENGLNLSLSFVLEIEEPTTLILILELLERFGYNVNQGKRKVLYGINEKFYFKNLWNFYSIGWRNKTLKKGKEILGNKDYYLFINEKNEIEKNDFEKELNDRIDLAKATIVQALNNRGDLITSEENEE